VLSGDGLPLPAALVNVPALANVPEAPEPPSIFVAALALNVAPVWLLIVVPFVCAKMLVAPVTMMLPVLVSVPAK